MFLHELPQTMGEHSVTGQWRKGRARRKRRGGGQVCVACHPSPIFSDDKWLIPQFTFHSNQVLNFFFYVSLSSPCCDRHLNWLSCAPGSDTTACCLLFVDYYWFSLILHLKINSWSRRKIGAVYTYFNILLCNREGRSFGSSRECSSQLGGKLLTGERERPRSILSFLLQSQKVAIN